MAKDKDYNMQMAYRIAGYKANLTRAIEQSKDGAYVHELDLSSALAIRELLKQYGKLFRAAAKGEANDD